MKTYNVFEHDDQYIPSYSFELEAKDLKDAISQYLALYEDSRFFEVYESDGQEDHALIYRGSQFYNNKTGELADNSIDYMNDGNHYEISSFATIERQEN
jgi:hypothetical protein